MKDASSEITLTFEKVLEDYWRSLQPLQKEFLERLSTRPDGVYHEELAQLFKPRPGVNVGKQLTRAQLEAIDSLNGSTLIEIEEHPGGRTLYRSNPLCEALFTQKRGKSAKRASLKRTSIAAPSPTRDLKWNPLLSIPSTSKPVPEIHKIIEALKAAKCGSVMDYGCGVLRHIPRLTEAFDEVWAVDLQDILSSERFQRQIEAIKGLEHFRGLMIQSTIPASFRVDAAVLIYVLHTLPEKSQREQLLRKVRRHLAGPRLLTVMVPGPKEKYYKILHQSPRFEDGFMMIRGERYSFYKEFRADELRVFVEDCGFRFVENIPGNHRYITIFKASD